MAITRKAFIIGAEFVDDTPRVLGVPVDKSRVYAFLRSDEGGAWRKNEIKVLENPHLVPGRGAQRHYDFQVTYFAGHGYTEDGEVMLCMNDSQDVPVRSLPVLAPKSLFIIDACRTVVRDLPRLIEKRADYGDIGALPELKRRLRARRLYDLGIKRAESGAAVMFASSYDESAWGGHFQGGYFTRNLIEGATNWGQAGLESPKLLSVAGAFQAAKSGVQYELRHRQNPEILTDQVIFHLPFAVRP